MKIHETEDLGPFEETHAWLRKHNAQHVSEDWAPVRLVAEDDQGHLVGSLDAEMFWGKLHVSNVIVAEDSRRNGVGTRLMKSAEEIASKRGFTGIYLETMSFQGEEFYLGLGFARVGELGGFENGSTMVFLHKAI
jgi:ribosomal protein S18 acetylase RimI-like enzyme